MATDRLITVAATEVATPRGMIKSLSWMVRPAKESDLAHIEDLLHATGGEPTAQLIDGGAYVICIALDRSDNVVEMLEGRFDSCYDDDFALSPLAYPQTCVTLMTVLERSRQEDVGRALLRCFAHDARTTRHRGYLALDVEQGPDETDRIAFINRCGLRTLYLQPDVQHVMGAPIPDLLIPERQ